MSTATVSYTRDFEGSVDAERFHEWRRGTGAYKVDENELGCACTLGSPKVCTVTKATGAIEKIYSIDAGADLIGSCTVEFWDDELQMHLGKHPGQFIIYPEHQEHEYHLDNGVSVREDILAINRGPDDRDQVDPGGVYMDVRVQNDSTTKQTVSCYAFVEIDGNLAGDVVATYDDDLRAFVAWNEKTPSHVRVFGCSRELVDYEVTPDHAMATMPRHPRALSKRTDVRTQAPLAVLHVVTELNPGESAQWHYRLCVTASGKDASMQSYSKLPRHGDALEGTHAYYTRMVDSSIVLTPNPQINRGAQWAKVNMLRVALKAPTGWGMTNSPTMSNNSVARDTAWFTMGTDFFMPEFSRAALQHFIDLQEPSGMIVEYYSLLDRSTSDFGLNINDDTPLLILAVWHHYRMSGDDSYLRSIFSAVEKAATYINSQRNAQGLVWCTSADTGSKGIIGWRNIIKGYRLSGATTEVNSECYAALAATAEMARIVGEGAKAEQFAASAGSLKTAINTHLANPENGLYYLNIDVDGTPRSDVTADLVFPVLFGVASPEREAAIVRALGDAQFWTVGGMRTVPRDAPNYRPDKSHGLLGGVWNGMTFWYAKCAAKLAPGLMDEALTIGFENYNRDPIRNNTVPGQFSEWLNGETLVNQGMMLSPWFPPRYLWAAIEGALGFTPTSGGARVEPTLAPDWEWSGARNVPFRGKSLTWLVCRAPELQLFASEGIESNLPLTRCARDISNRAFVKGEQAVTIALQCDQRTFVFAGNTSERSLTTALRVLDLPEGSYRVRTFDSLRKQWYDGEQRTNSDFARGVIIELIRKGFILLEITHA